MLNFVPLYFISDLIISFQGKKQYYIQVPVCLSETLQKYEDWIQGVLTHYFMQYFSWCENIIGIKMWDWLTLFPNLKRKSSSEWEKIHQKCSSR